MCLVQSFAALVARKCKFLERQAKDGRREEEVGRKNQEKKIDRVFFFFFIVTASRQPFLRAPLFSRSRSVLSRVSLSRSFAHPGWIFSVEGNPGASCPPPFFFPPLRFPIRLPRPPPVPLACLSTRARRPRQDNGFVLLQRRQRTGRGARLVGWARPNGARRVCQSSPR